MVSSSRVYIESYSRHCVRGGSPGLLTAVTSNGYCMAVASCEVECSQEARVILPRKACLEVVVGAYVQRQLETAPGVN